MFLKNKLPNFFQAVMKQRPVTLEQNEKVIKELTLKRTLGLMKKLKKAEEPFQVKEDQGDITIQCNAQLCMGLYIFVCAKRICMHTYTKGRKKIYKTNVGKNQSFR